MNSYNHIIRRQAIEVKLRSGGDVATLHDRVRNIYMDKIIPVLDTLFSGMTDKEVIFRINKLQLDLGVVDVNRLEEQVVEKTIYAFRESLEKKLQFDITDQDLELVQRQRSFPDTFLYFLETGELPWCCSIKDLAIIEKEIIEQSTWHAGLMSKLTIILDSQPQSTKRLIYQFSDRFLQFIIQFYHPSFKPLELLYELKMFFSFTMGHDPADLRDLFWQTACAHLTGSPDNIQAVIAKELVPVACEKYSIPLKKFMHAASKCEPSKFPGLHDVFADTIDLNDAIIINAVGVGAIADDRDEITTDEEYHSIKANNEYKPDGATETIGIAGKESNDTEQTELETAQTKDKREQNWQDGKVKKESRREKDSPSGTNKTNLDAANNLLKGTINKEPGARMSYPELVGLVILHPFLSAFFKALQLTDGKKFLHDEALYKAIVLLGYMATGEIEVEEHRLIIPKLLCGMELSAPVKKTVLITEEEQEEADKLLDAVLSHWTALKNTSRNGLRDTFLKRQGKLSRTDNGWQVEAEHKTWDILLSRLPWGFSMIKFSWMKELVFVNWG